MRNYQRFRVAKLYKNRWNYSKISNTIFNGQ